MLELINDEERDVLLNVGKSILVKREPNYDLEAALEYNHVDYWVDKNTSKGLKPEDILTVIAEIPGANDDYNWFWIVLLKSEKWAMITGGCDYTGWD